MTCDGCQVRDQEIRELRSALQVAQSLATVYAKLAEARRARAGADALEQPERQAPTLPAIEEPTKRQAAEANILDARDAAILDALLARSDGLTSRELLAAMPDEPHLSSDQRYGAYRGTLARLGGKVIRERDRFYLTRAGEMAALGLY